MVVQSSPAERRKQVQERRIGRGRRLSMRASSTFNLAKTEQNPRKAAIKDSGLRDPPQVPQCPHRECQQRHRLLALLSRGYLCTSL